MATSRIQITYEPKTDSDKTNYFMRATVDTTVEGLTTPTALQTCLVVTPGSMDADERIRGVGTYAEIVSGGVLLELPATVNYFESEALEDIAVGDVINIPAEQIPERWVVYELHPASTAYGATVLELDLSNQFRVKVATPFPAYGRGMSYTVRRGETIICQGSDGTANRDYSATPSVTAYRASTGLMTFEEDLAAAKAWRISADSDAWDLVKAYDNSTYESGGAEVEVYEYP
jgi:hypothetical protein